MATLIAVPVLAQNSHVFGLKAGLNLSRFNHESGASSGVKPGFNFGLYLKAPVGKNIFLRPELFYSNQGEKSSLHPTTLSLPTEHVVNLHYLNLPLLIEAGRKVTLQCGPQVSYILSAYDRTTINDETTRHSIKSSMNSFDLSGVIGIGINPHERFNAGMRLNYGLTDAFKADNSARNHVFHFYFGYTF